MENTVTPVEIKTFNAIINFGLTSATEKEKTVFKCVENLQTVHGSEQTISFANMLVSTFQCEKYTRNVGYYCFQQIKQLYRFLYIMGGLNPGPTRGGGWGIGDFSPQARRLQGGPVFSLSYIE